MRNISTAIVLLMLVCDVTIAEEHHSATPTISDQKQAIIDAERDARMADTTIWILAGFGCSILGVLAAHFMIPQALPTKLLGKSPEYVVYYTVTYQEKVRRRQLSGAAAGCGIGIIVSIIYLNRINFRF